MVAKTVEPALILKQPDTFHIQQHDFHLFCPYTFFVLLTAFYLTLSYFNLNSLALNATITVLKLISIAPIAGLNMKAGYRIPAANGMAMTL